MSFDFQWLTRVNQTISPFKGQNPAEGQATGGPTMWVYNASSTGANETAATVEGANYFLGASGFFSVGDWIFCDTNDPSYVVLNVTVVTAGTTVTTAVYETSGGSGSFTTVSLGDGSAAAPSLTFTADSDTGIYRIGSNDLGITAGGALVEAVSTTGVAVTGLISASTTISAGTNLSAGSSGTAGTVTSFPATAANGSLKLAAVNNVGNKVTTISSVAGLGQDEVITIPDAGAATSTFVLNNATVNAGTGSGSWGNAVPPTPSKVMTISIGGVLYYCPLVAQNT